MLTTAASCNAPRSTPEARPSRKEAQKNPVIVLHEYLQRLGRPLSEAIALTEAAYERALAALKAGDLAALHAVDREYTPFYCLRCPGVYCYEHMGIPSLGITKRGQAHVPPGRRLNPQRGRSRRLGACGCAVARAAAVLAVYRAVLASGR